MCALHCIMPPLCSGPQHPVAVGPGYRVLRQCNPPGYEVLCVLPGANFNEIQVHLQGPRGRLRIEANPQQPDDPWGVVPLCYNITLPGAVQESTARALMTLHGRLFVRLVDEPTAD